MQTFSSELRPKESTTAHSELCAKRGSRRHDRVDYTTNTLPRPLTFDPIDCKYAVDNYSYWLPEFQNLYWLEMEHFLIETKSAHLHYSKIIFWNFL